MQCLSKLHGGQDKQGRLHVALTDSYGHLMALFPGQWLNLAPLELPNDRNSRSVKKQVSRKWWINGKMRMGWLPAPGSRTQWPLSGGALRLPWGKECKLHLSLVFPKPEFLIHLKAEFAFWAFWCLWLTDSFGFLSFSSHIPKKSNSFYFTGLLAGTERTCGQGPWEPWSETVWGSLHWWVWFSASFWSFCSPPSAEVTPPWVDRCWKILYSSFPDKILRIHSPPSPLSVHC